MVIKIAYNFPSDNFKFYIAAPAYWWLEFYALGMISRDCSDLPLSKNPTNYEIDEDLKSLPVFPNGDDIGWIVNDIQTFCGEIIKKYEETNDKRYLRAFKQLVPSGYVLADVIYLSFEDIKKIYYCYRRDKSKEW